MLVYFVVIAQLVYKLDPVCYQLIQGSSTSSSLSIAKATPSTGVVVTSQAHVRIVESFHSLANMFDIIQVEVFIPGLLILKQIEKAQKLLEDQLAFRRELNLVILLIAWLIVCEYQSHERGVGHSSLCRDATKYGLLIRLEAPGFVALEELGGFGKTVFVLEVQLEHRVALPVKLYQREAQLEHVVGDLGAWLVLQG